MFVTFDVSQNSKSLPILFALKNILSMLITFPVSQLEMLKFFVLLLNKLDMSVTSEVQANE